MNSNVLQGTSSTVLYSEQNLFFSLKIKIARFLKALEFFLSIDDWLRYTDVLEHRRKKLKWMGNDKK